MRRFLIVLLVLVPVALAAGWLLLFSPWLSVTRVEVTVSSASDLAGPLSQEDVLAAGQVSTGSSMVRAPTGEIEERIAALPQVQSVSVTRAWPDTLVIDVVRREPIAVVSAAGGYDVVDSEGVVIRRVSTPDSGVPVVSASGDGLAAAIAVARDLPAGLRAEVADVEATTRNDVTLILRDGSEVMWGSAEDSAFKAEVLEALFPVGARFYDVSSPGVPATSDTPRRTEPVQP